MNEEDILELIRRGENEKVEFKAAYIAQYYIFEASYVNAIQAHIEAATNI